MGVCECVYLEPCIVIRLDLFQYCFHSNSVTNVHFLC